MRKKSYRVCSWKGCDEEDSVASLTIFQQIPKRVTEGTIHLCPIHKVEWRKLINSNLKEGERLDPKAV